MPPLIKRFLPPIVIAVALLGFVILRMTRPEPPPAGDEERRWPVAVIRVEQGDFAPQLRLFGQLTSASDAMLRARSAGDVKTVAVRSGQQVAEGDLLLQLDDLDARALFHQRQAELQDLKSQHLQRLSQHQVDLRALEQERSMLQLTERQYQRQQQLAAGDRASQRQVEEASLALSQQRLALMNRELAVEQHPSRLQQLEASIRRAEVQLQQAQRDLTATELRADRTLRIQEVLVAAGDRVSLNEPLLSVFSPQALEMEARLSLSWLPAIRAAMQAGESLRARVDLDGQPLVFELQQLAGRTSDSAGILATFVLQEGKADGLALGQFVDARLDLPLQQQVYWLPVDALQGRDRIYRIEEGRLQGIQVELLGDLPRSGQPGVLVRAASLQPRDPILANRLPNAMDSLLVDVVDVIQLESGNE
ncbi:MAG: biotin/lipoyl-binding protein [Marinospirillum sp.]|uniref:efflux RND transporter periplasmic adaptor subunit n=1 Tax=Marinospirillum sp. TaxID=2183934 RepID=UPI001A034F70|nr:biotin/lipoyl-binding protein [Marinospirillum sp.]MBE0506644.1 biotin/lipoyl-binding protein [Marinospirillum sp.]